MGEPGRSVHIMDSAATRTVSGAQAVARAAALLRLVTGAGGDGITVAELHVMDVEGGGSTSGLSSVELAAIYARQLERGGDDGVVALHLSKSFSSTWSAAVSASAVFEFSTCEPDATSVHSRLPLLV